MSRLAALRTDDSARALLDQRAHRLAATRAVADDEPAAELLVLRAGRELHGISPTAVDTVVALPNVMPIPAAPPGWIGVAVVRGHPVAVARAGAVDTATRLVVVRTTRGLVGLAVDAVLGTVSLTPGGGPRLTPFGIVAPIDPESILALGGQP